MSAPEKYHLEKYYVKDDGIFPNNKLLPVLHYKAVLDLPFFFPANYIKKLFKKNNWYNSWKNGVYTYHHYHSVTHEVMGVYGGRTVLQLGGENGIKVTIEKGDVIVIPAGVAHKNLEWETQVKCVGAYPDGKDYDMNFGRPGERPKTDENIQKVPLPSKDPVFGSNAELQKFWN